VEVSPDHPSFHVVAISLPGYGFSEAPKKKGFGPDRMSEVGHKVMLALGYNEYGK
jgi:pimeloyl-ACP methyl ester carboxylesterase